MLLADASGDASDTAFSDFLNAVVQSSEVKDALKELADTLNTFVTDFEADSSTELVVVIPEVVVSADKVSVAVSFSGDVITCTTTTSGDGAVVAGDSSTLSVAVISSTDVEALISVKLTANATGGLTSGNAEIIVTTDSVSITVKNTTALTSSGTVTSINLADALLDAKTELAKVNQELADKIPNDTEGLSFSVVGTQVVRNGQVVPTFITTSGGSSVSSVYGVVFE